MEARQPRQGMGEATFLFQSRQTRQFLLINIPQRLLRYCRIGNLLLEFLQLFLLRISPAFPRKNTDLAITASAHDIPVGLRTDAPDRDGGKRNGLYTFAVVPDFDAAVFARGDEFAGGEHREGVDEVCVAVEFEDLVAVFGPYVDHAEGRLVFWKEGMEGEGTRHCRSWRNRGWGSRRVL